MFNIPLVLNTPCTLCHHASDTEAQMCTPCPLNTDTSACCEKKTSPYLMSNGKINIGSGEDVSFINN